jgi:hypothetical protein
MCAVIHQFSMERAYFKLTQEYADVLGGRDSPDFEYYVTLVAQGLAAVRHIHIHVYVHKHAYSTQMQHIVTRFKRCIVYR